MPRRQGDWRLQMPFEIQQAGFALRQSLYLPRCTNSSRRPFERCFSRRSMVLRLPMKGTYPPAAMASTSSFQRGSSSRQQTTVSEVRWSPRYLTRMRTLASSSAGSAR